MTERARDVWGTLTPADGVPFGPSDALALARYCELSALFADERDSPERDVASVLRLAAALLAMERELGLTPQSRIRLGAAPADDGQMTLEDAINE